MLGNWRTHDEYRKSVVENLSLLAQINPSALFEYEKKISKLYILNLDTLKTIIAPLYSNTGRTSNFQPEIFRSFILMNHLGLTLDQWCFKIQTNFVLRIVAGFDSTNLPGIASYYDFINRIIKLDEKPKLKKKKCKPSKKVGKGKKLPPKKPGIVSRIVDRILRGRRFDRCPELILQRIFADVCVKQSINLDLIKTILSIFGDGTCIKTGASHFGVKTCECEAFQCDCPRKFSDPNATWGWDSHNNLWFYGYTSYFISTYNKDLKVDLPLYLRLVDAKRHDSISAVVAIAEFRDLYPDLTVDTFISDSASDNYSTYELLNHWNINAVIDLNSENKGNRKYPAHLTIDEKGIPICPSGHKMIANGFFGKDRCRLKWRCPRVLGKVQRSDACDNCSPSKYGRVIYTKPSWDLRLFTKIPRDSLKWKLKMNERTVAERVNNRILNHYGIENAKTRGKKRISFFITIAAFNVHLDAQINLLKAISKFDFCKIFSIKTVV
ncbi:hypothetical protein [Paramaledivibacter caminithermalis]|jgi:hypothetical protein|uniref:Transposase DDE domain-containing protein n=1 Tax=Paramaledivibacter caminithermalis (strain DSM 15212 / CIP 107654 / DViRD3) TaxID=1121301 RepID=A0A1M6QZ86_PARC5|nr:hypothetical protein [Paramaledivibacter caminithermalis]SHK25535.1 hypothetical protein SAMN02745912_02784 [Paramaledivibacter caminithermalis DSM 15212]